MRIGRSSRLHLPWQLQNQALWFGLLGAAAGLLVAPATAQGPPGAAAAAAGAAAAATASAPAPTPPKKTAASAAMDAAAMGNSALAPASPAAATEPSAQSGTTEVAANGPPPPPPITPEVAADIAAGPLPKEVTAQCANLLKLATLLKADVAKTSKDVLSISVVRDAGQIEEMAKKMREAQH